MSKQVKLASLIRYFDYDEREMGIEEIENVELMHQIVALGAELGNESRGYIFCHKADEVINLFITNLYHHPDVTLLSRRREDIYQLRLLKSRLHVEFVLQNFQLIEACRKYSSFFE